MIKPTTAYYSKYGKLEIVKPNYPNIKLIVVRVEKRPELSFLVSAMTLKNHRYIADIHLEPYSG